MAKKPPDNDSADIPSTDQQCFDEDDLPLERLKSVSRIVRGQWKELGRQFRLTTSMLDAIAEQCKYDGAQEKAYQTILCWKQRNPSTVTWKTLAAHVQIITGKNIDLIAVVPAPTKIPASSKPAAAICSTNMRPTALTKENTVGSSGCIKQRSNMLSTPVTMKKSIESPGGINRRSNTRPALATTGKPIPNPGGTKQISNMRPTPITIENQVNTPGGHKQPSNMCPVPVKMEKPLDTPGGSKRNSSMVGAIPVKKEKSLDTPCSIQEKSGICPTTVTKAVESTGAIKQKSCPLQDAMTKVSKSIGKDLTKLGRAMGVAEPEMENIYLDKSQYGNEEVAHRVMEVWRRIQAENATVKNLSMYLQQIGRNDIASQILPESLHPKVVRSSTVGISGNGPLTEKKLQANLRQKYKTLKMKGLPWMEDLRLSMENHYVGLEIVKEGRYGQNDDESDEECERKNEVKKKLKLKEIFPNEGILARSFGKRKPCKILVEGDAGFGKTTLASKLCYDYSNRENYLKRFDVVLLFPLRSFAGNLDEMISNAAFATNTQLTSLLEILNSKSVQTLMILDGYDELANEHISSILALIRGDVFPHVSVLVTTRPVRFTRMNSHGLADIGFDMEQVWDCQYKLTGLNEERQAEFVERHLKNFPLSEKRRIERGIKEMKEKKILTPEILKCPLFFLMIFMILSKSDHHLHHVKTMTELYKEVLNFVIRRYLTKYGEPGASEADLFTSDHANRPFYIDLMVKLGEISLSAIKADQLYFSPEIISKLDPRIIKIGILTQTSFFKGLKEVVYYEPVHKSLIEFAAAYSLLPNFTDGSIDQWKETVVEFRPTGDSYKTSLVLPFLAGLIGKKAGALFDVLQPHAKEYSSEFFILLPTVCEVQMSDSVMSSLIPFLPGIWRNYWSECEISSRSLPPEIMAEGLKVGKIETIWWDLAYSTHISEDIKVDRLVFWMEDDMCPLEECNFQQIECQSLVCHIGRWTSKKEFKALLCLVPSIHFQRISLNIDSRSTRQVLSLLHESLIKGNMKQTYIHEIECWLDKKEGSSMLNLLVDLITKDRIVSLVIEFHFRPSRQQLKAIFEGITISSRLAKFEFKCQEETCPLALEFARLYKIKQRCKIYNWKRELVYSF